jgi:NO-binding membrane sensor protein with MHYT domain
MVIKKKKKKEMEIPNNVAVQMVSADTDHQLQLIQYDQEIGSEMSCFFVCSVHFTAVLAITRASKSYCPAAKNLKPSVNTAPYFTQIFIIMQIYFFKKISLVTRMFSLTEL